MAKPKKKKVKVGPRVNRKKFLKLLRDEEAASLKKIKDHLDKRTEKPCQLDCPECGMSVSPLGEGRYKCIDERNCGAECSYDEAKEAAEENESDEDDAMADEDQGDEGADKEDDEDTEED